MAIAYKVIRGAAPLARRSQPAARDRNDSIPEQKQETRARLRFRALQRLHGACINADQGFGKPPLTARQRGHR
jgi:hypothetical protein